MKMTEGWTIMEHLNKFNIVTSQLTSIDVIFDDDITALLILSSLLKSWDDLVMALSNSLSSRTLKFDGLISVKFSEKVWKRQ